MTKATDMEFTDHRIERVQGSRKDGWEISFDGGMCFGVPKDSPVTPKVGMVARLYGRGFGYTVRGLDLDGVEIHYLTREQEQERHRKWVADQKRERREKYEAKREEYERRVAALPAVFRDRILKYRKANPDFRYEFEPYELFTCEEALKIAAYCKTVEAVREFHGLPWDKQKVAGLDDGHSGNTFGMACRLAMHYLTTPENVTKEHGALVALVGCEDYGCRH